ncbi:ADP-ribosylglycohydrolase family protein [Bacillus horti]|uniref:ADP-ribosylglycohydrolase n=1 Tax=Caldalkalibacillus horti TaxID=77523 RepID=A0ABT9W3M1_9BACI|nr:ADP-ribosylglycohydrolase family protein [Bacillus horti]MDQ0167672.1 ADP-ribosylglycohydrolase [Bacillus horti]
MIPEGYVEKIYAGFLGMNVGIRLGAPVEPPVWTDQRIEQIYGDITGYVKDYKNFAADDDANGPVFFIRALYDDAKDRELQAEDVGKAWLNYAREGIGMFWWGGEGVSTEHTSYMNLKRGIQAPRSGSVEVNGLVAAEQIGGQIFIDTWGLLFPSQIDKAADYAEKAASVSHDRNGLYGARFMAACIAKAFEENVTVDQLIEAGLNTIPNDSTYAQVVRAVQDFHKQQPNDFRACRSYLEEEWGYDKYTGVCHIIPNAGVCILALLYGAGDFSRTVEIATMCGWDTDCNAGNVGTIVGVLAGINNIPQHYRKPINDFIVTSSVSGYLNILDIPTFSKEVALLGYRLAKEEPQQELQQAVKNGEVYFDFNLPGATHGFRTDTTKLILQASDKVGYESSGSLEVVFDRMVEGEKGKIFYKSFYRREDFNDERYKPTFAPQANSGQQVSAKIFLDKWEGEDIILTPYVRETYSKKEIALVPVTLKNQEWNTIEFTIPETDGAIIDEVGFLIESPSPLVNRALGCLYLDEFRIYGQAHYKIDFSKQYEEFKCITPFSHNRGEWTLQGGWLKGRSEDESSSYSGNYYSEDLTLEVTLKPLRGQSHMLLARAQGIQRHYLVGFDGQDQVSVIKNDFGHTRLKTVSFEWKPHMVYLFKLIVKGSQITLWINDKEVLTVEDSSFKYGMFGFGHLEQAETEFASVTIQEHASE